MAEIIVDIGDNLVETIGCEFKGELVRCKECKHWRSDGGAMMVCENTDIPTDACDFCSWGEREGE